MKIIIYILLVFNFANLSSQGFDWQYSPRLPFATPNQFFGINISGSYNYNFGEFGFLDNQIPCCEFDKGSGINFKAGIKYENWIQSDLAIFSSINFNHFISAFTIESEPHPYRDFEDLITEYEYNSNLSYIDLELGLKYRLLESHFFTGLLLDLNYLILEKHEYIERNISANDFFFSEIKYPNANIPPLNKLYIYPEILLGYDLDLGKGKYSSLILSVAPPVQSVLTDKDWKRWLFSVGINVYLLGY